MTASVAPLPTPSRPVAVVTIARKALRDRWAGMTIGAVLIALFLWMGMAIYREIDLSLYRNLPEAFRNLFGFGNATDAATLAYGAVYGFYGGMTVVGIAIAAGAQGVAGEERHGTMGLLLGNPVSRADVFIAKGEALVALVLWGTAILWAAGRLVPAMLGVDLTGLHLEAQMVHLFATALFFGFMALGIGAATGRTTVASGITGVVLIVSFVAAGVLPLIESLADFAKAFPWYWYSGNDPVHQGVDPSYLALLFLGAVVFFAAGLLGLGRRDLRANGAGASLIDRLQTHPTVGRFVDRIAGSGRVSALWVKTVSDNQVVIVISLVLLFWLTVIMGPMYNAIDETLRQFTSQMPDVLLALVGQADMATPEGWFQGEVYAITAPAILIAITAAIGARAVAGEEQRRTLGLLLANPVSRTRVVLEKTAAMVVGGVLGGAVLFVSTLLGASPFGLQLNVANVAAASVLATLFALVIGALGLAVGAASGRVQVAGYGAAGVAFAAYLVDSFFPLNDRLADWVRLSPYHYYLGGDPLNQGMAWGDAGVLVGLFALLVGIAVAAFQRRDIHLGG
ncbi:MAG: ABC transporter permease subunit [Acidimicrobiia bacterium]